MKKIAIIGLGWLGMPLAQSLVRRGIEVVGSKTTPDGVEAARMSGINCFQLQLTPELLCDPDDLAQLMTVDALVITLPASRTTGAAHSIFKRYRWWSIAHWRLVCRALFLPARLLCMAKLGAELKKVHRCNR